MSGVSKDPGNGADVNQTALAILVGLLAGAAGALAVSAVGIGGGDSTSSGPYGDDGSIDARLKRIEKLLDRRTLATSPELSGSAPTPAADGRGGTNATVDAIVAKLEKKLKPMVQESVKTSVGEVFAESSEIETGEVSAKRKVTLAEAAAELGLTSEEEEAVRRIAAETTEEFFQLLADKESSVDDIRREFEDAKGDPDKKAALMTKYTAKAFSNLGGLVALGLNWQRKMKGAVGKAKADKIDSEYSISDLDPYGLEAMFDFD